MGEMGAQPAWMPLTQSTCQKLDQHIFKTSQAKSARRGPPEGWVCPNMSKPICLSSRLLCAKPLKSVCRRRI